MPNRYMPVTAGTDLTGAVNQFNRNFSKLDAEAVTKVFKGANNTSLIMGKTGTNQLGIVVENGDKTAINFGNFRPSSYGLVLYDTAGLARVLIGMSPDDGRMGTWVSKPGQDVIVLLGG